MDGYDRNQSRNYQNQNACRRPENDTQNVCNRSTPSRPPCPRRQTDGNRSMQNPQCDRVSPNPRLGQSMRERSRPDDIGSSPCAQCDVCPESAEKSMNPEELLDQEHGNLWKTKDITHLLELSLQLPERDRVYPDSRMAKCMRERYKPADHKNSKSTGSDSNKQSAYKMVQENQPTSKQQQDIAQLLQCNMINPQCDRGYGTGDENFAAPSRAVSSEFLSQTCPMNQQQQAPPCPRSPRSSQSPRGSRSPSRQPGGRSRSVCRSPNYESSEPDSPRTPDRGPCPYSHETFDEARRFDPNYWPDTSCPLPEQLQLRPRSPFTPTPPTPPTPSPDPNQPLRSIHLSDLTPLSHYEVTRYDDAGLPTPHFISNIAHRGRNIIDPECITPVSGMDDDATHDTPYTPVSDDYVSDITRYGDDMVEMIRPNRRSLNVDDLSEHSQTIHLPQTPEDQGYISNIPHAGVPLHRAYDSPIAASSPVPLRSFPDEAESWNALTGGSSINFPPVRDTFDSGETRVDDTFHSYIQAGKDRQQKFYLPFSIQEPISENADDSSFQYLRRPPGPPIEPTLSPTIDDSWCMYEAGYDPRFYDRDRAKIKEERAARAQAAIAKQDEFDEQMAQIRQTRKARKALEAFVDRRDDEQPGPCPIRPADRNYAQEPGGAAFASYHESRDGPFFDQDDRGPCRLRQRQQEQGICYQPDNGGLSRTEMQMIEQQERSGGGFIEMNLSEPYPMGRNRQLDYNTAPAGSYQNDEEELVFGTPPAASTPVRDRDPCSRLSRQPAVEDDGYLMPTPVAQSTPRPPTPPPTPPPYPEGAEIPPTPFVVPIPVAESTAIRDAYMIPHPPAHSTPYRQSFRNEQPEISPHYWTMASPPEPPPNRFPYQESPVVEGDRDINECAARRRLQFTSEGESASPARMQAPCLQVETEGGELLSMDEAYSRQPERRDEECNRRLYMSQTQSSFLDTPRLQLAGVRPPIRPRITRADSGAEQGYSTPSRAPSPSPGGSQSMPQGGSSGYERSADSWERPCQIRRQGSGPQSYMPSFHSRSGQSEGSGFPHSRGPSPSPPSMRQPCAQSTPLPCPLSAAQRSPPPCPLRPGSAPSSSDQQPRSYAIPCPRSEDPQAICPCTCPCMRNQQNDGAAGARPCGATGAGSMQGGTRPCGAMQAGAGPCGAMQAGAGPCGATAAGSMQGGTRPCGAMQAGAGPCGAMATGAMQSGTRPCGAMQTGAGPCGAAAAGPMQTGAMQGGTRPCGAMQAGAGPCGAMATGAMQSGTRPCGAMQAGAMPCGSAAAGPMQTGAMQGGTMPCGAMQAGTMQTGAMQTGTMPGATATSNEAQQNGPCPMSSDGVQFTQDQLFRIIQHGDLTCICVQNKQQTDGMAATAAATAAAAAAATASSTAARDDFGGRDANQGRTCPKSPECCLQLSQEQLVQFLQNGDLNQILANEIAGHTPRNPLFNILVKDNYWPGVIEDAVNAKIDFNRIAFDAVFGCNVPEHIDEDSVPMTLIEAFEQRILYEKELQENMERRREFCLNEIKKEVATKKTKSEKSLDSQKTEPESVVDDEQPDDAMFWIHRDELKLATTADIDMSANIRDHPETGLTEALACLFRAEKMNNFDKFVHIAEAVIRTTTPDKHEKAAIKSMCSLQIDMHKDEKKTDRTYRPLEIISYIGTTKLMTQK